MPKHVNALRMRQRHFTNAFAFDFFRSDSFSKELNDEVVGSFEFANFSQAQNARLKVYDAGSNQGDVALKIDFANYRMTHTYTKRAYFNDVLYQIVTDKHNEELARIELIREPHRRWPKLFYSPCLTGNSNGQRIPIEIGGNFFRRQFTLNGQNRVGEFVEIAKISDISSIFSPRRQVLIESTGLSSAQQALLGIFVSFFRP